MQTSYSKTVAFFFFCFNISIFCFYFIFLKKERGREGRRQLAFKTVEHQSGQHQACPICGHVGQPTLTIHSPAVRATNFKDQLSPSQLLMAGRSRNQLCVYSMAHSGLLPPCLPFPPTMGIISHLCGGELASEGREDTGWPPAFFFGHRVRSQTVLFQLVLFRPGNRKSEPRKLKQRKNQDSRRAKIWSGQEKKNQNNLIKEERKEKKNTQKNSKNIP